MNVWVFLLLCCAGNQIQGFGHARQESQATPSTQLVLFQQLLRAHFGAYQVNSPWGEFKLTPTFHVCRLVILKTLGWKLLLRPRHIQRKDFQPRATALPVWWPFPSGLSDVACLQRPIFLYLTLLTVVFMGLRLSKR